MTMTQTMTATKNVVAARNISKIFKRDAFEVRALDDVSIEIGAGEFMALMGPSGSGKTTLLSLIAGLSVPDGGELRINGRDATYAAPHERDIGLVFQNYALFPHMTVAENIAFPLRMRRVDNASALRRATEALELVRLPQVAARYPKELSGGQQQRIALARCLVYKPSIVLMDEPLGALDKKLRDHMQLEIKRIHRDTGATIVYVTHDQEEAMTMSDRICLMNGGNIEQLGTPSDLYFAPKTLFVADFIGESNLLRGRVSGTSGSDVEVTLGDGTTRVTATAHATVARGDAVRVMVRPQNIARAANGTSALRGRVVESMITGSLTKLYLESPFSGDEPIVMSYPTSAATLPHAVGSELAFSWHAGDAVAVPEAA